MAESDKPGQAPGQGSVVSPRASPTDPRRLLGRIISGRYRIDELIGEGGMGAVYRAEHTHMRKRLAIKVLHPEMIGMVEAVERFEREAIAGAHIEHPNVAAATDFGKLEDGSHFLVLEFLEGEDLRTLVGRGPLPADRAVRIARQIAMALRAAHQLGIVHRDLKPENIMLVRKDRESDVVKVLDFGIAKVPVNDLASTRASRTAVALTRLGMVYGTPEYMAPEQALGEELDGRADLYALGVMFYEMLSGVRPFEADSRVVLLGMVATKRPPSIAQRIPGIVVPREIEDIVMRLLEKTAAARYADADALVEAIDVAMLELDYPLLPAGSRVGSIPDRSGPYPPISVSLADRAAREPPRGRQWPPAFVDMVDEGEARVSTPRGDLAALEDNGLAIGPDEPQRANRTLAWLRGLPPIALVCVSGVALIGTVVATAVFMRSGASVSALEVAIQADAAASAAPAPETTAAPTEPPRDEEGPRPGMAPRAELEAARAKGLTDLGPLAQRYPEDPAALKALLLAHAADKSGYISAVRVAKRLFDLSPAAVVEDDEVQEILFKAASGPPEAASVTFHILSTQMTSHGPDILFGLATAPSVGATTRQRAHRTLDEPKVKRLATPALRIANDLRKAVGCQRKPMLSRAAEHGDARSLPYLRPLLSSSSCSSGPFGMFGSRDCYPCFGSRSELRAAIEAIEHRSEKH